MNNGEVNISALLIDKMIVFLGSMFGKKSGQPAENS